MKEKDRLKYIDVALRIANVDINKTLLLKLIDVIDLVDKKGGNVNIKDVLDLKVTNWIDRVS